MSIKTPFNTVTPAVKVILMKTKQDWTNLFMNSVIYG